MKKFVSCLLLVALLAALFVPAASAAEEKDYTGKTVILATGNIRGDIDLYPGISAARQTYKDRGASVYLVDMGGHLQGSAYANFDRGQSIYNLMQWAGYDVVCMNQYDFAHGDATTGYPFHGNFHRYYTQAELKNGAPELEYRTNSPKADTPVMETRPAIAGKNFKVICSNRNLPEEGGCYSFIKSMEVKIKAGKPEDVLSVKFLAFAPENMEDFLQDGLLDGYPVDHTQDKNALISGENTINFVVNGKYPDQKGLINVTLDPEGDFFCKAYVIDPATLEVTEEDVDLTGTDEVVAEAVAKIKAEAPKALGVSEVSLNGKDSVNRNGESNLGDFTADALLWYGESKFEGFQKDVPLVAIQNGGNCDHFLYKGDITEVDLLKALPFSPLGVGILYLTGEQLLETLEAGTQTPDCPGWPQVAGLKYTVHTYKPYDKGEEYGKFFKAKTLNRVEITEVGGKPFDKDATYAVIADNFLIKGNDTYYTFKEAKEAGAEYLNNGGGVKVRDITAKYLTEVLEGKITEDYAAPQGRIILQDRETYVNPFQDVKEDDWFAEAVQYVNEHELMMGTGTDTFEPQTTVTRAMLVTTLYRIAGKPEASQFDNPFTDVPDDWYTDAVCWANHKEIAMGTGTGLFSPMDPLTREQAAAMLWRYSKKPAAEAELDFADADQIHEYAQTAMMWAVSTELLNGYEKGGEKVLDPLGASTRAQLATILMRFTEK